MSTLDELVERWKARTGDYVRCVADIWWDPCCPELVAATFDDDPTRVRYALLSLGRARRLQRFDLVEAIDDLHALCEVLPPVPAAQLSSLEAARVLAQAWREDPAPSAVSPAVDPLSRHPSFDYLIQRAEELYEASGTAPGSIRAQSVVIARLRQDLDPLTRLTIRVRIGVLTHELFAGWPRGMSDDGFIAITSSDVATCASLELSAVHGVEVHTVPLPYDHVGFQSLLVQAGLVI